ncbi:hypothetical protein ACTFIY_009669 [Dictyostelium cf. discoideum]
MLSSVGTFDGTWEPEFIDKIKKKYFEFESKESEWFDTFKSRQDVINVYGFWYIFDAKTGFKRLILVDKETLLEIFYCIGHRDKINQVGNQQFLQLINRPYSFLCFT